MPVVLKKHMVTHRHMIRDSRPASVRFLVSISKPETASMTSFILAGLFAFGLAFFEGFADVVVFFTSLYFYWWSKRPLKLSFKLPRYANCPDPNNPPPGKSSGGVADGILFLGNVDDPEDDDNRQELWLTNNDARTHILYLGTTGSGKTEGLKSLVTNALAWGSGFAYTDGKADTDLWASLYALARRFGRDDDILILNYMTGNSDDAALSNTMNPFSNGSASYLANMVTNLMPDAGGDNAMWKERAVSLMFALMPALTFMRDKRGLLLDVGVVRDNIELQAIIKLSRDTTFPDRISHGLQGYLRTLPGYVDAAFDDEGNERPPSPDQPMYDLQVARQQHGYLSMQFTRALQSLADEYGYIFKAQLADIDVLDVVLNRRIMVVLIPALEKSRDEAANLGKIVAASLKGMMGATLGNTVEGSWEMAIGSKQTRSASSFMTVFDEVGYYTAQGMAVMAAQARSLGFSLVFASQDLPSMEKLIKTEARSIVGNCNLKILGRIEDPTDTKEFVQRHGGIAIVMESKGMTAPTNTLSGLFMPQPFYDDRGAALTNRQRVDYDHLRGQKEGEAHLMFGDWAVKARMFHAVPGKARALRVHRLLPVPGTIKALEARERAMSDLIGHLKDPAWSAQKSVAAVATPTEITALAKGAALAGSEPLEIGVYAIAALATVDKPTSRSSSSVTKSSTLGNVATVSTDTKNGKKEANKSIDASKSLAQTKGKSSDMSQNVVASVEVTPQEKAQNRASLPPLAEGDQYAITEIESAPSSLANNKKSVASYEKKDADVGAVIEVQRAPIGGFSAADADASPIAKTSQGDGSNDVFDLKLPQNLLAVIEKSAQKLNEGLSRKGNID